MRGLASAAGLVSICIAFPAQSQEIKAVPYSSVRVPYDEVIGFEGYRDHSPGYFNVPGALDIGPAVIGERFAGQRIALHENLDRFDFDFVRGEPSAPLALEIGRPNQNLDIEYKSDSNTNVLFGIGVLGVQTGAGAGEGTVAILLKKPACAFGFKTLLEKANISDSDLQTFGKLNVTFYDARGRKMDSFVFSNPKDEEWVSLGFRQSQLAEANIMGVLIQNFDRGGAPYDDLKFDFECDFHSS